MEHARIWDIPDWSTPLTVAELIHRENSWGATNTANLVVDDLGYFWVKKNGQLRRHVTDPGTTSEFMIFWQADGVGIWVPPAAQRYFTFKPRVEIVAGWLPVTRIVSELPDFVHMN